MWVFPGATKDPPCTTIKNFLRKYGYKTSSNRIVRTDLGGEIPRSQSFKKNINASNFTLETTAPHSSFQTGHVERIHRTIGNIMRSMLVGAGLNSLFWSDALLHAAHVKNILPHSAIHNSMSLCEA